MSDLHELLSRMDVPSGRFDDLRWLSRNLGVNNRDHPDFPEAARIIKAALRGDKPKGPVPTVTPQTAIHGRSVVNVDTERLAGRLEFLRRMFANGVADSDNGRNEFSTRVRETVNIERELTRRNVPFVLVTNGHHLAIDVHEVPIIRPHTGPLHGESRKDRLRRMGVESA